MKHIHLIGFQGTGHRDARYLNESGLILVGHVGFAFEGETHIIFGFHPTDTAAANIGDTAAVISALRQGASIDGVVQDDYLIFQRAWEISQSNSRTTVWRLRIQVTDVEFERIRRQVYEWYTEKTVFAYSFPNEDPDTDNCATFPRRLGLPLPEPSGHLVYYVKALMAEGERWFPEDMDHEPDRR